MAFPVGWNRSCPLVIQHSQVPANQTAFPVLITNDTGCLPAEMVTSGGAHAAQSDGGDIRFSSDALGATQLPCEVARWVQNATASLAEAQLWVPVSVLTGSDVTIYVWYSAGGGQSQPAASSTFGSQNVWTASFQNVYHMQEASNATATDSTSSGNDSSVNVSTQAAGKFGKCQSFNGSSEYLQFGMVEPGANLYTISAWQKASAANYSIIFDARSSGFGILIYTIQTTGVVNYFSNPGGVLASTAVAADGTWHYVVITSNGTSAKIYVDNNAAASGTLTPQFWAGGRVARDYQSFFAAASTQEFRIATVERSANWITTEFNNQNSPSSFVVAGSPVGGAGGLFRPAPLSGLGTGGPFFSNPLT